VGKNREIGNGMVPARMTRSDGNGEWWIYLWW